MKEPTNKCEAKTIALSKALSLILAASIGLTACEAPKATKKVNGQVNPSADTAKSANKSGENPTAGATATDTNSATNTSGQDASSTGGNTTNQQPRTHSDLDDLPQLSAARSVSLANLKDSLVICTVNGTPLTIEAFKREFRDAVLSLQGMLTTQPEKVNELINNARQVGVTLTDDEKKRLLETARHKEALEGKTFQQFLKDKKITEAQFNEQVLLLGLAFKTGTKAIESQLLSEMINRELVLQAARKAGLSAAAMNHFINFKHSPRYDEIVKASPETPEQIKDEIVNHEMMVLMLEQIAKTAEVSDETLKQQYEKNKESFKHGERVRISHIIVAAPEVDNPPLESIRSQIKKQKPKLTKEELDNEEKVLKLHQHDVAQELLSRALKGEDFKTLADRYSDDVQARASKTGGDLGFLDLSVKVPGPNGSKSDEEKLCDAVKNLKPGQVAPELVHTAYGWHIVKLTAKEPAGYLTFAETKPTLKQLLSQQNKEQAEVTWVKDKRKSAVIKLSDEFVQASANQKDAKGDKPVVAQ